MASKLNVNFVPYHPFLKPGFTLFNKVYPRTYMYTVHIKLIEAISIISKVFPWKYVIGWI